MAAIIKEAKVGRANRRIYKPERDRWTHHKDGRRYFDTDRAKAWEPTPGTKLTGADLSLYETELGVAAVAYDSGFIVGRILGYDQHKNVFTVVGTRRGDSKPVEAKIAGWRVAQEVIAARVMCGVKQLTRKFAGR